MLIYSYIIIIWIGTYYLFFFDTVKKKKKKKVRMPANGIQICCMMFLLNISTLLAFFFYYFFFIKNLVEFALMSGVLLWMTDSQTYNGKLLKILQWRTI